jgi:succinate-acetate transporter protein
MEPIDERSRNNLFLVDDTAGLFAGLLALYIGMGQVINEVYGRKIFPV